MEANATPQNIHHWDHPEDPAGVQWRQACHAAGVTLTDAQVDQFRQFYNLLLSANQTTNLTRITALEDFLYRHLLDSLAIAPLIAPGARLADVGSGAGFPSIPLSIARPDLQITAVESVGKKCQFMQSVKEALDLQNLTVVKGRSEDMGHLPEFRARFDVACARAVSALPVLLELCLPLVKTGGRFLAMKGLSFETELEASGHALKTLGGKLLQVHRFAHLKLEGSRVLEFEKTAPTPKLYPRQAGLPAKKPL